jgi:hypothetical protein
MAAVEAMQRQSVKAGKHRMTLEEISAEIRAARKERRKCHPSRGIPEEISKKPGLVINLPPASPSGPAASA